MDVSPAMTEVGGYGHNVPAVETDSDEDEDEDVCRICRSPEEPEKPLRYPCLCRGSIKYVHQDCLRLWLNRRGNKQCEVCGRSYSFVPVYSENAPERLPCNEFLIGVLLRVARYMKLIVPWIVMFLFNTYCSSLHPLGQEITPEFQGELCFAFLWAGLAYIILIVIFMNTITLIRIQVEEHIVRRFPGGFPAEILIGNGLRQGVIGGVLQVLWKYTKILCDWHFVKFIHFLGRPPRRLIFVPLNVPLDEFGVFRRLLFFLDDDAFAVLAISVYLSILFVFLPFSIGRIVLATVGGSYLSGYSPVTLGYKMMLSSPFAYFGILFTLRQYSFTAILRWVSLGFHFVAVKFPCLLWAFSVKACKNLYVMMLSIPFAYFGILFTLRQYSFPAILPWVSLGFHFVAVKFPCLLWVFSVIACKNLYVIKDAFVLFFKIGVLPWIIGYWLEICISPLFRTTFSQRYEDIPHLAYLVVIPWLLGFICVVVADAYMNLIQEIIHQRAFWYLLDVTDPDYKITKLNLGYTFFAFASHGVLLVILFYLPIRAITLISPSFFPLEFWITDEKPLIGAYSIYFNLIHDGPRWLIKHTKPAIRLIVRNWIVTVSSWLQLSDFLLVVPQGEGFRLADQNMRPLMQPRRELDNNPWLPLYIIAEGSMVISHVSQNAEEDIKDQRDNRFLLRIALMLVLAALSLFLFSTTFMALPILVGRVFFDSISFIRLRFGIKHDDFCAFWIGCYVLRRIYISTCFVADHIQKGRIDLLLKFVLIRIRNGLLFSIWIFVIPGLLGLLIDLMIIIPSRVALNESPVYILSQDWLIGVVVLHSWILLTMLTPIYCFATNAWRGKFERIRNVGINRLPSMWLLRDVTGSMINTLVITLSIPYLLVKALFPLLGFSQSINAAVERFIWPALLALITVWFMAKLTRDLIIYLHQLVFNERYLVGERVDNLTEDTEQRVIIHGGV